MKFLKNKKAQWVLAFILGVALVFGFSPFRIWPLGFLIPAILFLLVEYKKPKSAFSLGFFFGLGEFGFGTSWIYVSLAHYGNGIFLAGLVTLGFILILALFPASQMWLMQRYSDRLPRAVKLLLIYPLLWLVFEIIRSWIFTGFPWLLLGYTQTFTNFAGFAKVGSVFLVSYMVVLVASLLLFIAHKPNEISKRIVAGLAIIVIFIVGSVLRHHQFTHPNGSPIQVALVQGNISEDEKWQPGSVSKILTTYADLTGPILNTPLIIWPENAITDIPQNVIEFIGALDENATVFKSAIVFGIPVYDPYRKLFYNGAMAVGQANGLYLKQHLIPFGEYLPYPSIFGPVFDEFNIPMSFFSKGPSGQSPMVIRGLPVRLFICYESAYPILFRQAKDSAYIITLTDDAWFGNSLGPYQHEEMEVMRAIETGRPILRATNSGMTSIIDQNGKVLARAPMFEAYVLKGEITPVRGETPWLRI